MSLLRHQKFAHEIPPEEALAWFQDSEFLDSPPYFLTHWKTQKRFFFALGGLVAFEETPRELVIAGEPLLAEGASSRKDVLEVFCQMAARKNKGVCGYYVGEDWQSDQFSKATLGSSTVLPLDSYNLEESKFKEVRRALRKGAQHDLSVVPVEKNDTFRVQALYEVWRSTKSPVKIQFLLSKPQSKHLVEDYEEWFAVEKNGEFVAFCSLLPYIKRGQLCFYLDHILHHPEKESHALSYLISFLIETLSEQGVAEFNLGLSPFATPAAKKNKGIEKVFSIFYNVPIFYRAKGLHFFKKKFGGEEKPEYCFFNHNENKLKQLAEMAGVTFHFR